MTKSTLNSLQTKFLSEFFRREDRFFLTGGAALADSPREILANKLCALLSRSEIRDLVDVRELENAGFRVEDALDAAALKNSGFTPGQLGWVLSQITFGEGLKPPGNVPPAALRDYLDDLVARLARWAFPK